MTLQCVTSYLGENGPGYVLVSDTWYGVNEGGSCIPLPTLPVEKHILGANFVGMVSSSGIQLPRHDSLAAVSDTVRWTRSHEQMLQHIRTLDGLFEDVDARESYYPELSPHNNYTFLIAKRSVQGLELYALLHDEGKQQIKLLHRMNDLSGSSKFWINDYDCPLEKTLSVSMDETSAVRCASMRIRRSAEKAKERFDLSFPYIPGRLDVYTIDAKEIRRLPPVPAR